MREGLYHIGEVCSATGLSQRTLRHWDEIGVVRPSHRSPGGFRVYTEEDLERVRFVMALRPLDITLQEKAVLLAARDSVLHADGAADGAADDETLGRLEHAVTLAEHRGQELERQIAELRDLVITLRDVSAARQTAAGGDTQG
jgi:MerR family copper efflux transcriptional regulator